MITQLLQSVLIRPRRSLGGLFPDVVIEESHEDALEITEHPVEFGTDISDHSYRKAAVVTIRGGVSDSTSNGQFANSIRPSVSFYDKLLELMNKREPFEIITGKRAYRNMLITRLTAITTADSEYALPFTVECREVLIAQTRVVSVSPRQLHSNGAKTGAEADIGQKQAAETQPRSLLDVITNG